jgi:hypothetical protein
MYMKQSMFPFLMLLVSLAACGQESHLDRFYHKFAAEGTNDLTGSVNPSFLLNISCGGSGDSGWMHKITMVRCLTVDAGKTPDAGQEWNELAQSLRAYHFEEWFSIRHKGDIRLLSKDRADGQEEVVCVIVDQHGSGLLFHLRGRFTAADKDRISGAFRDEGR